MSSLFKNIFPLLELCWQFLTNIKNGSLQNILTKQSVFITTSLILTINLYFGNFLNIPMTLTYNQKKQNFLDHRLIAEQQLLPYVKQINELVKGEEFALVAIAWKKTESLSKPLLSGRYLFVMTYDKKDNKPIDARHKLKDPNVISYNYDTSAINFIKNWCNNKPILEFTFDYETEGGENVPAMFNNYWFSTFARTGITYLENESDIYATRFVIMLSKGAVDNVKNQGKLLEIITKIQKDYVDAVSGY